jgi:hypothetical protein
MARFNQDFLATTPASGQTATKAQAVQAMQLFLTAASPVHDFLTDDELTGLKRVSRAAGQAATQFESLEFAKAYRKPATHFARQGKTEPPTFKEVAIGHDDALKIALAAYHQAIKLKTMQAGMPVILYRVPDKKRGLSKDEKSRTVSSALHVHVGHREVWPLIKTAAWIQGAMRARISFLLLTDPRVEKNLKGGLTPEGDAVYVVELADRRNPWAGKPPI